MAGQQLAPPEGGDEIIRALTAAALLAVVAGCAPHARTGDPPSPTTLITYTVTGTAEHATMSALTPDGETETLQHLVFRPPMRGFDGKPGLRYRFGHGDQVLLTAAVTGPQGTYIGAKGSVTCTIKAGSTVVATQTASAGDGVGMATCEGVAP